MHININYTITFEQWREASRTHRTPVRLRPRRSWRRRIGWLLAVALIVVFLCITGIRRDPMIPAGARPQYIVDPTIPISLLPQILIASFGYLALFRRSNPSMRRAILKPVTLMLLISIIFTVASGYIARQAPLPPPPPPSAAQPNPLEGFLSLGSWLLLLLVVWFALAWMVRNIPHAEWNGQPSLYQPHQATIADSGLSVETPDRKWIYEWRAIMSFRESAGLFLLYNSEYSFEVIPKSAFSPADLRDFTEFLMRTVVPTIPGTTAFVPRPSLPPPPIAIHVQPLETRNFM